MIVKRCQISDMWDVLDGMSDMSDHVLDFLDEVSDMLDEVLDVLDDMSDVFEIKFHMSERETHVLASIKDIYLFHINFLLKQRHMTTRRYEHGHLHQSR